MGTTRLTVIRVELLTLLLLLTSSPLIAQDDSFLRRRSPKRIKQEKNRGNLPSNDNITIGDLDPVRNQKRKKRDDALDELREDTPHMMSSGNGRPRDIPALAQGGASSLREDLLDNTYGDLLSQVRPGRPFRYQDKPNRFDNTKPLEELVQDLLSNEQLENQEQAVPEAVTTVSDSQSKNVTALDNRPNMTSFDTTTVANDPSASSAGGEPIIFIEENATELQITAPAYRPSICGTSKEDVQAMCASKPSCSRALPGEDCYPECSLLDPLPCGSGKQCIPYVSGCVGFAALPTDLEDTMFTRLGVDNETTKRAKEQGSN